MKIYTKKGDKGETRLLYGDAVSKDSIAPEAYGSVDELVAALGLVRYEQKLPQDTKEHILRIQRELFVVGAELATSKENRPKLKPMETLVTDGMVEILEKESIIKDEGSFIPTQIMGSINIKQLIFSYTPGETVINDISVEIKSGEIFSMFCDLLPL